MSKNYRVRIPIRGYRTVYVEANSKEEAVENVLEKNMGVGNSDMEDEIDYNYRNESEIEVRKCDEWNGVKENVNE